jgi:flagellar motor switch protein FliM
MDDSGTSSSTSQTPAAPAAPAAQAGIDPSALLRALAEAVEHDFCLATAPSLQVPLEARAQGLVQATLGEFLNSVEERTCCLPLTTSPACHVHPPLVEISPQIAFGLIDRLLGGTGGDSYIPARPLTALEGRLLRRLVESAAACITRHWPWASTEAFIGAAETLPDFAAELQAAPVIIAKFTLTMGRHAGAMRLCLPAAMVPLMGNASDGAWQGRARGGSPLELSVVIQDEGMTAEEVSQLAAGDIVVTDTAGDGEVIVRIAGIPKFYGRLASANGRRAIRITRRI